MWSHPDLPDRCPQAAVGPTSHALLPLLPLVWAPRAPGRHLPRAQVVRLIDLARLWLAARSLRLLPLTDAPQRLGLDHQMHRRGPGASWSSRTAAGGDLGDQRLRPWARRCTKNVVARASSQRSTRAASTLRAEMRPGRRPRSGCPGRAVPAAAPGRGPGPAVPAGRGAVRPSVSTHVVAGGPCQRAHPSRFSRPRASDRGSTARLQSTSRGGPVATTRPAVEHDRGLAHQHGLVRVVGDVEQRQVELVAHAHAGRAAPAPAAAGRGRPGARRAAEPRDRRPAHGRSPPADARRPTAPPRAGGAAGPAPAPRWRAPRPEAPGGSRRPEARRSPPRSGGETGPTPGAPSRARAPLGGSAGAGRAGPARARPAGARRPGAGHRPSSSLEQGALARAAGTEEHGHPLLPATSTLELEVPAPGPDRDPAAHRRASGGPPATARRRASPTAPTRRRRRTGSVRRGRRPAAPARRSPGPGSRCVRAGCRRRWRSRRTRPVRG